MAFFFFFNEDRRMSYFAIKFACLDKFSIVPQLFLKKSNKAVITILDLISFFNPLIAQCQGISFIAEKIMDNEAPIKINKSSI